MKLRTAFVSVLLCLASLLITAAPASAQSCANLCGGPGQCQQVVCEANHICYPDFVTQCMAPKINAGGLSPTSGPSAGGTLLSINGSNLIGNVPGQPPTVAVGAGAPCTNVIGSPTSLNCTTSAAAPGGPRSVQVTTHYQNYQGTFTLQSAPFSGFFYTPPTVASVLPPFGAGAGGTQIQIAGTGFATSGTSVTINGQACAPITLNTATSIWCNVPAGTGTHPVVVTTAGATVNGPTFRYVNFTSISPTHGTGTGGNTVTINGSGFGTALAGSVALGSAGCQPQTTTDTQITCIVVPGGNGGAVTVTLGGTTFATGLSYAFDPFVATVNPSTGGTAGGTVVTLSGNNFGSNPALAAVTIGGNACPINASLFTNTSIVCTTPAGAGTNQPIAVTINGVAASPVPINGFSYLPSVVTGISPAHGPTAGTAVNITGQQFAMSGNVVTIGGVACPITSESSTVITCTAVGQGLGRQVSVAVNGQQAISSVLYDFDAPVVMTIAPGGGSMAGGTPIGIVGSNFGTSPNFASVTIGGLPCPLNTGVFTHNSFSCTTPPGAGLDIPVVVTIAGQASAVTALSRFDYQGPAITQIQTLALTAAGPTLDLFGRFAPSGNSVLIDGLPCPINLESVDEIVCIASGEGANAQVQVTSGGQTAMATYAFAPPHVNSFLYLDGVLTISGSYFGTGPTVTIDGVSCPVVSASFNSISCTPPNGTGGNHPIVVTAGAQVSNSNVLYTYPTSIITAVEPQFGATSGESITITGSNFQVTNNAVTVGGVACPITDQSPTSITCNATGQGPDLPVIVANNGITSNAFLYSFGVPAITTVSPAAGHSTLGGTEVVISGFNFGTSGTVTIGGAACAITSYSHTSITCTTPAGMGVLKTVAVTSAGRTATSNAFSYKGPLITNTGTQGGSTSGATVTITGTDFSSVAGLNSVSVGGTTCVVTSQTPTQIGCLATGQGQNQPVVVVTDGQTSNVSTYSFGAPVITGFAPLSGPTGGGVPIIITGNNFGTTTAIVTIGGQPCPVVPPVTHTQITCTLPAGSGTNLPLNLTAGGQGTTATQRFSYSAPAITSITPSLNLPTAGADLTIAGSGFAALGNQVAVGGFPCAISSESMSQIICHATGQGMNVPVVVTAGGQSSAQSFVSFAPPTINTITPPALPTSGGQITIAGTNFGTSGTVDVAGGGQCSLTSYSQTQIVCVMPSGVGVQPIFVRVSGLQGNAVVFHTGPAITSVTPGGGLTSGHTITIAGSNFGLTGNFVTVADVTCPITLQNFNTIECTASGQGTSQPVVVTTGGQVSTSFPYSFGAPVIDNVAPPSAPAGIATPILISGHNFGTSAALAAVSIGGTPCVITSLSHTQIACTTAAGSPGLTTLAVAVAGQVSNAFQFAYDATTCDPGNYLDGSSCNVCDPGFFSPGGSATSCQACAPGTVAQSGGSASCSICPANTFSPIPGGTVCIPCQSGYESAPGSPVCAPIQVTCDPPLVLDPGINECVCAAPPPGYRISDPATCAVEQIQDVLSLVAECVQPDPYDASLRLVRFGYENRLYNDGEPLLREYGPGENAVVVSSPDGDSNITNFSGAPLSLAVGIHTNAFSVRYAPGQTVTWSVLDPATGQLQSAASSEQLVACAMAGPAGAAGANGQDGPQGDPGPQGIQGETGAQGPQGPAGQQGAQGNPGPQGPQGMTGPQGIQGPAGADGAPGAPGATGPQGETGPQGATGPAGQQGPQGAQGQTGADGATGPAGPAGPQGPRGQRGERGEQGVQGPPGNDGADGPQGPIGNRGPRGPQGERGEQGPAGPEGKQGPQGDPATMPVGSLVLVMPGDPAPSGFTLVGRFTQTIEGGSVVVRIFRKN